MPLYDIGLSISWLTLIWSMPFLGIALTLAVLMIAADWQSSKQSNDGE
jgi:hypothetical protein